MIKNVFKQISFATILQRNYRLVAFCYSISLGGEIWRNDNEIPKRFSEISVDKFRYPWYNTDVISFRRFRDGIYDL